MTIRSHSEAAVLRAALAHGNALNSGSAELQQTRIEWDTACGAYARAHEAHRVQHNAQSRPVDAEPMDVRVKAALIDIDVVEALAWEGEEG